MDAIMSQTAQAIENLWRITYRGLWDRSQPHGPSPGQRQSVRSQVLNLWQRASNWATLVELNRLYLQRRLPVCASYGQPPEIETDRFTKLLRLHEYGLISTNSCPGWTNNLERQRAFLYFSIPTQCLATVPNETCSRVVCRFIQGLLASGDVRAYIRFQYKDPPNGVQRDHQIVEMMPHNSCDNLPEYNDNEWEAEGWDMRADEHGEIDGFSFVQHQRRGHVREDWDSEEGLGMYDIAWDGSDFQDAGSPIQASRAADPLQICVVARDWHYRGVGELIEGLLLRAGVVRGFVQQNGGYPS